IVERVLETRWLEGAVAGPFHVVAGALYHQPVLQRWTAHRVHGEPLANLGVVWGTVFQNAIVVIQRQQVDGDGRVDVYAAVHRDGGEHQLSNDVVGVGLRGVQQLPDVPNSTREQRATIVDARTRTGRRSTGERT